jgi:hypothetical protein
MNVFFVYAVVFALSGLIPWLHFEPRRTTSGKILALVFGINFMVGLVVSYLFTPFFYGPYLGISSTVLGAGIFNALLSNAMKKNEFDDFVISHGTYVYISALVVFLITAISGMEMFRATEYRDILGSVENRVWEKDETPIDLNHIRIISREQAEWLGNKVIGEAPGSLGSRYKFGEYTIQRVRGELCWVAPLEFHGIIKWLNFGHSVGFVIVSAEDRTRQPRLITNKKMLYMPSAFFGKNLTRYLYTNGYARKGLTEYTFELDDDLNPYWVITAFKPSITYFGPKVEGVVILNPETGKSQYYAVNDVPEWVDRVYPEEFVEDYLSWNGRYVQGWWNSWLGEENVELPSPYGHVKNDVFLVWSSQDQQPYWFSGLTSAASTDQSLTGLVMVNSRTGQARRYRATGPNERGVLQAVNNAISNYEGWRGTQPILYNINGEKTWVVPVVGGNNILQRIALVRLSNGMVSLGTDINDAMRNYRSMLSRSGLSEILSASSSLVTKSGLILTRMSTETADGKTLYYLYFEELAHQVFTAISDASPELPITKVGDRLTIQYVETLEPVVQIIKFDNEDLNISHMKKRNLEEEV